MSQQPPLPSGPERERTGCTRCIPETWARRVVTILFLLLVVGVGWSTVYRAGPHQYGNREWGSQKHRTDFTAYTVASKAILDGNNIYEVANPKGLVYHYLPIFAIAMVPLALVSTFWAALIWYLLSVLMVWHTIHLSARLARRFFPACRWPDFWIQVAVALVVLQLTISGIARGQASFLVTYLMTLCVWFYMERRPWWSGFCLAGSIVLKIFPALLVVFFVLKRRFLMAAATAVWLVVMIWAVPSGVFGWRGNQALLDHWLTTIIMPATKPDESTHNARYKQMMDPLIPRNQSVQAVAIRWLAGHDEKHVDAKKEALARHVAMAINGCLFLISAWVCWRGAGNESHLRTLHQLCVVLLLMLFLSPVSWTHNYTAVFLPIAIGLAAWAGGASPPMRDALGLGVLAHLIGSLLSILPWWPSVHGALLLGTMALWAAFVWVLTNPRLSAELETDR